MEAGNTKVADLATTGFAVRYDAASNSYFVGLPSYQGASPSKVELTGESSSYYTGLIAGSGMNPVAVSFRKPGSTYQYTNLGFVGLLGDFPTSVFAFGQVTPQGSVPVMGTATYLAELSGASFNPSYYIRGSATLDFNFAAGTLSGHLDPDIYDLSGGFLSLGQYTFTNTIYSTGSTTFSGSLLNSSNGQTGSFDGLFTGPFAQELMGSWNAGYINPDTKAAETMFGVMIGSQKVP